ncbi:SH3 domain-containing protein [Aggregatilinea lenta]|uniref:SH3 domain-containing protein n=1 Tax=Aggregatilinea lenta TaxID=913108 RepID=UPI000E5A4388|nr:hypothetical protein [Aggregatilinea lenta]
MKRFLLPISIIAVALLLPLAVHAQSGNDLIVLDDSTPGIDVVINPNPGTTGVVAIETQNASVTVTDAVGNVVFETADPAIKGIEFSFAPNAGTHTLTVERLPGAIQAYARIVSLPEMTALNGVPQLISSSSLAVAQEADFPLNASTPSSTVDFTIPEASAATITANFPGAPVTAQLVATEENRTLATLSGSLIDGVRMKIDSGAYELVLLNNNTTRETVANVSVLPAPATDFDSLVVEAEAAATTTIADTSPATPNNNGLAAACTITISTSSANLRSGPGTGYSVLDYAFRGENLVVGGVNPESGWLLVGTDTGSGWIRNDLGSLDGSCENLPPYDVPYMEASAPQVAIQQSQVPVYRDDSDDDYEEQHEQEYEDQREGNYSGEDDDHAEREDD